MYLYGKTQIDGQLIKFAAFVTGVSIGHYGTIFYTLVPTIVFIEDAEINILSVEADKNNVNGTIGFRNKTEDILSNAKCDFFTDSLAFVNLLKME